MCRCRKRKNHRISNEYGGFLCLAGLRESGWKRKTGSGMQMGEAASRLHIPETAKSRITPWNAGPCCGQILKAWSFSRCRARARVVI